MSLDENKKENKEENSLQSDLLSSDPMSKYKNTKKSTKSPKKSVIGIICGVVVIAALAGVIALAVNSNNKTLETEEEETTVEDDDSITLFADDVTNDVKTVVFSNTEGDFEIYRQTDATDDEDAVFALKGYEDYAQESSIVKTLANNIVGLQTAQTVVEDTDDLDKFGLGDDAIKATVTLDNGETESFRIGDLCSDTSYKYFCLEGENTVYTVDVSKVNNYSYGIQKFLSKTMLDSLDDDSDVYVTSLRISRDSLDYDIYLAYDQALADENDSDDSSAAATGNDTIDLAMVEPVACNLQATNADSTVNGLFGLTASDIAILSPSEDDFASCGLDNPICTVTCTTSDDKEYVLKVGNTYNSSDEDDSEEYYYVYLEGGNSDIVYGVTKDSLTWLTVMPIDISSKIIMDSNVWKIGTLDVKDNNGNELKFVGSGSSKDDYVVTKNGEECETERYRAFYAFLIKAYGEEFAVGEEPEGDPILTVTYKEQSGSKGKTIEFYDSGNLKCLIVVDGVPSFKCRKSFVEAVLNNIDIFDTDEDFATSWE
jgi:hypothetical protein